MVSFTEAAKLGVTRTLDFTGRSSRSEYWWFVLAIILGEIGVMMVVAILPFLALVAIPLYLWVMVANLSAMFRRVRDAGSNVMLPLGVMALGLVYGGVLAGSAFDQTMMTISSVLGLAYLAGSLYLLYVLIKPSASE